MASVLNSDTGSSLVLAPLVEALRELGKDPALLFDYPALADAALNILDGPGRRIDNTIILRAWERAVELTGDENFGLLCAAHCRPGTFHIIDYLVTSAVTLRDGLEQGMRHLCLLHDLAELCVVEDGELTHLDQQPSSNIPMPRAETDYFLACLATVCRRAVGAPLFVAVSVPHPAPRDRSLARRIFACDVRYDAPCARLTLATAHLSRACVRADPALHRILLEYGAQLLGARSHNEQFLYRVRRLLARDLPNMRNLEQAAKALGMSPRTLRRRLAEHECSYQQLVDGVRHEAAARLLGDQGLSLDEVALRVGLSSANTLSRAFRRWSGMTPATYRGSLRAPCAHGTHRAL